MSPVTVSTIGSYIREQREQAKISIRQLAQAAGVSNPYLSQVERGLRRPSADILQQIAKGLRISAEALYVQAGILDDRPADTTVPDAIMTDPELTERQKQMLIEIYESFRKEVRAEREARAAAVTDLEGGQHAGADPASGEPELAGVVVSGGWPAALAEPAWAAEAGAGEPIAAEADPSAQTSAGGSVPGAQVPAAAAAEPAQSSAGWPEPGDQVPAATATR